MGGVRRAHRRLEPGTLAVPGSGKRRASRGGGRWLRRSGGDRDWGWRAASANSRQGASFAGRDPSSECCRRSGRSGQFEWRLRSQPWVAVAERTPLSVCACGGLGLGGVSAHTLGSGADARRATGHPSHVTSHTSKEERARRQRRRRRRPWQRPSLTRQQRRGASTMGARRIQMGAAAPLIGYTPRRDSPRRRRPAGPPGRPAAGGPPTSHRAVPCAVPCRPRPRPRASASKRNTKKCSAPPGAPLDWYAYGYTFNAKEMIHFEPECGYPSLLQLFVFLCVECAVWFSCNMLAPELMTGGHKMYAWSGHSYSKVSQL